MLRNSAIMSVGFGFIFSAPVLEFPLACCWSLFFSDQASVPGWIYVNAQPLEGVVSGNRSLTDARSDTPGRQLRSRDQAPWSPSISWSWYWAVLFEPQKFYHMMRILLIDSLSVLGKARGNREWGNCPCSFFQYPNRNRNRYRYRNRYRNWYRNRNPNLSIKIEDN